MRLSAVGLIVTLALNLVVGLRPVSAQRGTRVPRIGLLSFATRYSDKQPRPFLEGLGELGWFEGQNLAIERRYADGSAERLAALAAELVQLRVDVLEVTDVGASSAAQQATSTIPIVMMHGADQYVASLARPGGNITGLFAMGTELAGKRLELLKEAVPGITRVAVLGPSAPLTRKEIAVAAQVLGVQLQALEVQRPDEFAQAFEAATRERADALLVLPSPITFRHKERIINFAAESRLPAMYGAKGYIMQGGGLMSYGPSYMDIFRRAATYVDKILKGAKPADLPVEQPMKFELVINLKTAKALGITIPPTLLLQADEVIQ